MITIYPTTTFMVHENNEVKNYQVITLSEYLYDQDIDQFFIKNIHVYNQENQHIIIDPKDAPTIYLGYYQSHRDITLIFRKDSSGKSWLRHVTKVEFDYKENIPNWDDIEI